MTYFTDPNFVDRIIKSQGFEGRFDPPQILSLLTLIEMETRNLIETALKFANNDRRDAIKIEDIVEGLKQNGHDQFVLDAKQNLLPLPSAEDAEQFKNAEQILEQNLVLLENLTIEEPKLQGRWIFIKGKIPSINQNINLKSLSQLNGNRESENIEKKKYLNVVKDDPYSLLSKQQSDYFFSMTKAIGQNINPDGNFTLEGDLNNLFPFFLKYLGEYELNSTGICFLLKLLDNKYVWAGVEYYLKKVLNILLAYRGIKSFEVGVKIAQLVDRFSDKYPMLRDIYIGYSDQSFSTILKKIPFELYLGIPFEADLEIFTRIKNDSESGNELAKICMLALLQNASELKIFRDYLVKKQNKYIYWHPCHELKNDPYLRMF